MTEGPEKQKDRMKVFAARYQNRIVVKTNQDAAYYLGPFFYPNMEGIDYLLISLITVLHLSGTQP